jgi:hypothetical protein
MKEKISKAIKPSQRLVEKIKKNNVALQGEENSFDALEKGLKEINLSRQEIELVKQNLRRRKKDLKKKVEELINLRRQAKKSYKKAKANQIKTLKIKIDKEIIKPNVPKKKAEVVAG